MRIKLQLFAGKRSENARGFRGLSDGKINADGIFRRLRPSVYRRACRINRIKSSSFAPLNYYNTEGSVSQTAADKKIPPSAVSEKFIAAAFCGRTQ